jgi:hypothetical protein
MRMAFCIRIVPLALAVLAPAVMSYGQIPAANTPVKMRVSEQGTEGYATWTFLGPQGIGEWPSGEVASLTYVIDGNQIVFTRVHSTGSLAGLVVTYTGTKDKDGISGKFMSNGHKSGNWFAYATKETAIAPPSTMHLCGPRNDGTCCTFRLENGQYTNYTNLPYQANEKRVLTIESFSRESIVLRRVDTGSYPLTATITGQISSEGNSLVNGTQRITSFGGKQTNNVAPARMTWGTALDSVPGSDDLDAAQGRPQEQQQITMSDVRRAIDTVNTGLDLFDLLQRLTK